jgi:hypothetical protein
MLKARENVQTPTPEPLSTAAVNAFFARVREQMSLPVAQSTEIRQADVEPRHWAEASKRAGAIAVDF